jgi:hypothetical protein
MLCDSLAAASIASSPRSGEIVIAGAAKQSGAATAHP